MREMDTTPSREKQSIKGMLKVFLLPLTMALSCLYGAPKKNVLFIAVDDLKPLLNCYGYDHVISPHIDALAKNGMVFSNAHCQQAVCGPSRVSLLTGKFPDSLGIYGMGGGRYKMREMHPDILTLPLHFKNNGYETIGMGKIFDPRNVEDDWHGPQDKVSWTKFYGKNPYNKNTGAPKIDGHYHDPALEKLGLELKKKGKAKGLKGKPLREFLRQHGGGPAVECYDVPDDAYSDGAIANRALEQIDALSKKKSPFFLAVGFKKPHLPFVAPKKYWDMYDRSRLSLAPFQHYPKGSPKVAQTDYIEARTYGLVPNEGAISEAIQRELIHGYLACVSYVDAQIGKIVASLKSKGLYENTVIVLWGDHGFHLGDKEIWGKHTNYEESTRSPLIVSNHGGPYGGSSAEPVNLIDIFPTLNDLCSLPQPQHLDGKSLMPLLKEPDSDFQSYAASLYPHSGYMGIAIRSDRYRYVAWYKGNKTKKYVGQRFPRKAEFTELYDYQNDPHERENLAGKLELKEVEERMATWSREHIEFTQARQKEF